MTNAGCFFAQNRKSDAKCVVNMRIKIEEDAIGGDIKADCLWLRKNSAAYNGRWVALNHGDLLGSDSSRLNLHRSLEQSGELTGAMFFRISR